jgi:hypothetical protein
MEVIGQSVKSFNTDPLTSRIIEVLNYPIRKRSKAEQQKIDRVKRLRKVQLLVSFATEVSFNQTHVKRNEKMDPMDLKQMA